MENSNKNIDLILENQSLKNEFIYRNLDLDQIFHHTPENLEYENNCLNELLDWVIKYHELGSRQKMEAEGYLFPPVDPDISPDNDWFIFEKWLKGEKIRLTLKEQLGKPYIPKNPEHLSYKQLITEIENLVQIMTEAGYSIDLNEGIPPELVYLHMLNVLEEEFMLLAEGWWQIDGCDGYCPGCFQRPWCESGLKSCWSEDEKAGKIVFTEEVKKYVSPSSVSLSIIRRRQDQEDKEFEEFMKSEKGKNNPF